MKYLYLDHNIYIEALKNELLRKQLQQLVEKDIQCLYSPAHVEEIYRVTSNDKSKYKDEMKNLMSIISAITSNTEVLPTSSGLILEKENPDVCYWRVRKFDTRKRVEEDSNLRYTIDKNNYNDLLKNDKHVSSLSNITPEKIWENSVISKYISNLNENIDTIIECHNNSPEIQILGRYNIDKKLPADFSFKKGNFLKLKTSQTQLEYTIEILFRVLNYAGYYSEKNQKTSVSGTHDVSHAIYATKSDVFISTDKRFVKKCQAVYSFLGINTFVIYCEQNDISNVINNI